MPTHHDLPARKLRTTTYREPYIKRNRNSVHNSVPSGPKRSWKHRRVPWAHTAFVLVIGITIGTGLDRVVSLDAFNGVVQTFAERGGDWFSRLQGHFFDAIDDAKGNSNGLIHGRERVIDGDTLQIQDARIRLHGIDAPESQKTCRSGTTIWHCGRSSTNALNERLSGHPVSCHARAQDRYGRTIAVCTVSGEDINAWLVSQGWALAYRKYSLDYTAHEDLARSHRRGIWSSEFIPPWRWRRGERL